MAYALLQAPAVEPLTIEDVKAHLRLDNADEDNLLKSLITVARDHLERSTGLLPITQSWRLYLDSVCEDGMIQIVKGPVQSLAAIRIYDGKGNPVSVDITGVTLDRTGLPARLALSQPLSSSRRMNGVEVDFSAGFGSTPNDVPGSIRRALLLHVAAMYEYRGAVTVADQPAVLPDGYDRLIAPFRMRGL